MDWSMLSKTNYPGKKKGHGFFEFRAAYYIRAYHKKHKNL